MPNLLLSFLATTVILAVALSVAFGFAWLPANAPTRLFHAMLAAGVFGLAWALVHGAVADRRGR